MRFSYDSAYFPPAPSVEIRLAVPGMAFATEILRAFVDTGADACIVPMRYLKPLKVPINDRKFLRSSLGERRKVKTYLLDVGIGEIRLPIIEIAADEWGDEVVLGRNALNKLIVTLNGPKRSLEVLA